MRSTRPANSLGSRLTLATASVAAIIPVVAFRTVSAADEAPSCPNVVFLYTDDQARWGMGAYGYEQVATPNMDRIAREGALFRNAFVTTPVCSPSRVGMFCGRYGTQVGITDWINPQTEPELGLDPSAVGWPELLKAGGYATALFGKWHLGVPDRFHPTRQGYDHFFGFRTGGNQPLDPTLERDGVERAFEGSLPDLLVDDAIEFVRAHREGPFLASVHFRAPHTPYAPVPEEDSAPFADLDLTIPDPRGFRLPVERTRQLTREYYGSIHSVDRNIGRLLDVLDELGIAGETIVIFTSDHGYQIGHNGLWHKGNATWLAEGHEGRRPNMFEESIRVPLAVRWPEVVEPGTEIDAVVSNLDLFPTILDLAGIGTPENLHVEGRSAAPLLRGEPVEWDDTLFGQYDMHHGAVARMRMVRTPEWKLIRHFEPGVEDELFHLAEDPEEERNLVGSEAHRTTFLRLNRRLHLWMASIGDPLLSDRAAEE